MKINHLAGNPIRMVLGPWGKRSLPQVNGIIFAKGLEKEVIVERDRWGVPSIYSAERRDLFFAQGFVHAQDRLWQMDINRRAASGRLAEILGQEALETDRLTRTLGFRRRANRIWQRSSSAVQSDLEAYSAGINAFLANQPNLPLEFSLLGYRPERWDVLDSVSYGQLLAWTLSSGWAAEIVRARLVEALGQELAAQLEPNYPERNPVTLPGGIEYQKLEPDSMIRSDDSPFLNRGLEGSGRGSNGWVIASVRSTTGHPILCNDMHLPIPTPSLWYFNRLISEQVDSEDPGLQVFGVSQPGLPHVLIGHNQNIAWGATLTLADTEDLFVEKFRTVNNGPQTDKSYQYKFKEKWLPVAISEEIIQIKGSDPFLERVLSTHHGPVVSSVIPTDSQVITLSSYALKFELSINGFAQINIAQDWQDFVDAVRQIQAPSLNLLYADTAGNIGYYMSGKVPIRSKGQGLVPSPGWSGEYEWEDYVPFDQMPHAFNPKSGYIVSANNKIIGDDYPFYLGSSWRNGYRAARIEQMILGRKLISLQFCREMQMDCYSIPGVQFARQVEDIDIKDDSALQMAQLLVDWDGSLSAESIGGTVYQVVFAILSQRILKPLLGSDLVEQFLGVGPHPLLVPINELAGHWTSTLLRLLCEPEKLCELTGSSREELIVQSLAAAKEELERLLGNNQSAWHWGRLHYLNFDHLFSLQPTLGRAFGHGPFPVGGDSDTVFQNAIVPGGPFHSSSVSPSQRHLIDLGDLSQSKAILVPGQSGQLGSAHYGDLILPWFSGDYFNMSSSSSTGEPEQKSVLRLRPDLVKSDS
ncbi:MAG: penicillin acylase family protein [Anaerolineae bacterium]|nr:MAG: penicillin acylase family protein [Anaerolineae bacterium]